jgi:hypothetical protein
MLCYVTFLTFFNIFCAAAYVSQIGFYEEVPGGFGVELVYSPTYPGVEAFLESFCIGEHDNPSSFFKKDNKNLPDFLAEIAQSLPYKQHYNFP